MKKLRIPLLIASAVLLACVPSSRGTAQENRPGATHLFITFRCKPADRPAFIRALRAEGVERFAEYKRKGIVKDYLLLYNEFVDALTWDAMVMLTFEQYEDTERWRALELESPGGLTPSLLALGAPHTSYFGDRIITNGTAGDRSKSIFTVIPYDYSSKGEYVSYIKTYGVPQFDGWIAEGCIAGYGIFLNHHATGEPWDALLLFEYRDIEQLGRRDIVKQKVRAELAKDPGWKLLSDSKHDYRTEREVVMAKAVVGEAVVGVK
jgi:hypothetical protein